MSLPQPYDIVLVPGRLCKNPTDLTTAFPHGGTALGNVRDKYLHVPDLSGDDAIPAEEYGGYPSETTQREGGVRFACVLRSWDPDMLALAFPNYAAGATTGKPLIGLDYGSGKPRAGAFGSTRGFRLCFSPDDTERHEGIILYNAIPLRARAAQVALNNDEEVGIELLFMGTWDSSKRVYYQGRLRDLSAT